MILCGLFGLNSCGKWNNRAYSGEGTVNGAKPAGETIEKFKLETKNAVSGKRRFITMDAANHVLGYCGLEVWNRDNATEGNFELVYHDTQCDTIVNGKKITVRVTSGDIVIKGDEVKLSLIGNDYTPGGYGAVYRFEITGKSKGWLPF